MTPGPGQERLVCVTGRFQPVHADHLRLFRTALAAGDRLVVGVTNPDPGTRRAEPSSAHRHRPDANPFTFYERLALLAAALPGALGPAAADVRVVPFDLGRPEHWAHYVPLSAVQYVGVAGPWERDKARRLEAGGYRVVEVPAPPGPRRSATEVRECLRRGDGWEPLVPPATVPLLRRLLAGQLR